MNISYSRLVYVILLSIFLLALPGCSPGSPVAIINPTPTIPNVSNLGFDYIRLDGVGATGWFDGEIYLTDPSFDVAKERMGKLWLISDTDTYHLRSLFVSGNWTASLIYQVDDRTGNLRIFETAGGANFQFPGGTIDNYIVGDNVVYLVNGGYYAKLSTNGVVTYTTKWPITGSISPDTTITRIWSGAYSKSLIFSRDGFVITITAMPGMEWSIEELFSVYAYLAAY